MVVGGAIYVYGREEVPVTGRYRFNLFSPETMKSIVAGNKEEELRLYGKLILPPEHRISRKVERVMQKLIPVSGIPNENWEIYVIDDPDMENAFVMPGCVVHVAPRRSIR